MLLRWPCFIVAFVTTASVFASDPPIDYDTSPLSESHQANPTVSEESRFSKTDVIDYFLSYEAFSKNLYAEFDVRQIGPTPLSQFEGLPTSPWTSDQARHIIRYRWMTQGDSLRIDETPISSTDYEQDDIEHGFLPDPSGWCFFWNGQNGYERRPPKPIPGRIEYTVVYRPTLPGRSEGFPFLTGYYPWPSIIGPESMSHLVKSELVLEERRTDDAFLIRFARRNNPDGFQITLDFEITPRASLRLRSITIDVTSNEDDPELRTVLRKTFHIDGWMDVGDHQLPKSAWIIEALLQAPAFITQGVEPFANCIQYRMREARPFDPDVDGEAFRRPVPRKGSMVHDSTLRLQYTIGDSWLYVDAILFQMEKPIDDILREQLPKRMKTAIRKGDVSK